MAPVDTGKLGYTPSDLTGRAGHQPCFHGPTSPNPHLVPMRYRFLTPSLAGSLEINSKQPNGAHHTLVSPQLAFVGGRKQPCNPGLPVPASTGLISGRINRR